MEIKIVEITDENRSQLLYLAIAGYIGEKCQYCEHVYESVEDIAARDVVYAGKRQYACKACFDAANPANTGLQSDGACTCAPKMPFVKVVDGQDICLECNQPRR
jgi:hypothetical protein